MAMSLTDEERIRARAYALWIEEGRPDGRDREHWERAERELRVEQAAPPAPADEPAAVIADPAPKAKKASRKSAGRAAQDAPPEAAEPAVKAGKTRRRKITA